MDLFPLINSLRIAAISSVLVFFLGIGAAYWASRLPRGVKAALDVALTLPLVLPPTVCGFGLLLLVGARRPLGMLLGELGMITPPVGINLYVGCNIAGITVEELCKKIVPFILAGIVALIIITYIPQITMLVPNLIA